MTPDADGSSSRQNAATSEPEARAPRTLRSALPLAAARTAPLTTEKLREHLGRFGESGYALGKFENALEGEVILPIGELNRLRRELVFQMDAARAVVRVESEIRGGRFFPTRRLAPLARRTARSAVPTCASFAGRWSSSTRR